MTVQHEASVILIGVILSKNYTQNKGGTKLQGVYRDRAQEYTLIVVGIRVTKAPTLVGMRVH